MAKRCLIITYYFPPFGGGGVQRISKLVKFLNQKNWECHIITAKNDISNVPVDKSLLNEIPDTVDITRVSGFSSRKRPVLRSNLIVRWLVSFFFVPDIRRRWIKKTKPIVLKKIKQKLFDLILISVPPYSLALLAKELKDEINIPIILDMRDPWTNHPLKIYPTFLHKSFDKYYEKKTISKINYIVSVGEKTKRYLENIGDKKKKLHFYIPNGFDEEDFKIVNPISVDANFFHLVYSGTLYSHLNDIKILFKVFELIKKKKNEIYQKIKFHYVGNSHISLEKIANKYDCSELIVDWGYKAHSDCLDILASANAFCLIYDSKTEFSDYVIGGKTYEYLAFKKPILALVPENGDAAFLINKTKSGEVIDPYKTEKIADIIIDWIENRNFNQYTFEHIENYSRKKQVDMFIDAFEKIINKDIS